MPNELPVIPEHIEGENCIGCPYLKGDECIRIGKCPDCAPDCPACLYIKLAKYLVELDRELKIFSLTDSAQHFTAVFIPAADWAEIKRLAEEN